MKCFYSRFFTAAISSLLALTSLSAFGFTMPFYKAPSQFLDTNAGNWFLSGSVGIQRPVVDSRFTVNNGSGATPPSNVDSYSTDINPTAAYALDGGYRWKRNASWVPAYALGLRYAHSFAEDIGGQITQYSLPGFTNYNYHWDIYSDIFMLLAKINLFEWRHVLPYFSAGAGVAFNTAANYQESALAGVIARESPLYARNTKGQPAFSLGLGVDWQIQPAFLLSLGYEYQNLGTVSSGSGVNNWAGSYLRSGTYQTSSAMLGLTWLL